MLGQKNRPRRRVNCTSWGGVSKNHVSRGEPPTPYGRDVIMWGGGRPTLCSLQRHGLAFSGLTCPPLASQVPTVVKASRIIQDFCATSSLFSRMFMQPDRVHHYVMCDKKILRIKCNLHCKQVTMRNYTYSRTNLNLIWYISNILLKCAN